MKKWIRLAILPALLLFCSLLLLPEAHAATEGYYTYSVSNGKATITDCDTAISGDITIPSTLGGYPVIAIGNGAFTGCSAMTGIVIPEGVTSIGSGAFSGCRSLKSMTIPFVGGSRKTASDTYQYPLGYIFGTTSYSGGTSTKQTYYGSGTSSTTTTTYYIPGSLETVTVTGGEILRGAFYNCKYLTEIILPDDITNIGRTAFTYCTDMTQIAIPASVTNIEQDAFYGCSGLTQVIFDEKSELNCIGEYAFSRCTGLGEITIPASVTNLGGSAFYGCTMLSEITIPANITEIGNRAFYGCTGLLQVSFEENGKLTCIGDSAFYGCTKLSKITIPANITEIGSSAFYGCTGLLQVSYAENCKLETIGVRAFQNSIGLTVINIPDSVKVIGGYAFYACTNLKTVNFGNSVSDIGEYAFYDCTKLTGVVIPDSVTAIEGYAFGQCDAMTSITFGENSRVTSIGQDAFFGSGLRSIVIPKGVTVISDGLFSYCDRLTSVTLHEGITEIGGLAFYNCSSLGRLNIPNSVVRMGATVFWNCGVKYTTHENGKYLGNSENPYHVLIGSTSTAVTSFTIHEDTKILYGGAFENCSSLTEITIPDGVTDIGNVVFSGCTALTSVNIPEGVTEINRFVFNGCSSLKNIQLPDSITIIKESAFKGCSGLTEIAIPAGVKTVESNAFNGCSSLTAIVIPDGVTSIGRDVLAGCGSIETLTLHYVLKEAYTLSDGVYYAIHPLGYLFGTTNYVGATAVSQTYTYPASSDATDAFIGYYTASRTYYIPKSLKTVTITGGNIADYAFKNCKGVTIDIGGAVTGIGEEAFYNCTGLTAITIPNGVTAISAKTFYGCTGLTSITIPLDVTQVGSSAFQNCTALKDVTYAGSKSQWDMIEVGTNNESLTGANVIFLAEDEEQNQDWLLEYLTCVVKDGTVSIQKCAPSFSGDLVIPDVLGGYPVVGILDNAFADCTSLTSITIPAGVTKISSSAFSGCSSLTGIWADEENPNYCSDSLGVLYNKTRTALLAAPSQIAGFYTILDGVTTIGNYAFDGCSKLTGLFFMDESLETIGAYAFRNCTGLLGIVLPETVSAVGEYAFYGCMGLTTFAIPGNIKIVAEYMLAECSNLSAITIPNGVEIIGQFAFAGCGNVARLELPDSVREIGGGAFARCRSLHSITLPILTNIYNRSPGIENYWQEHRPVGYFFGTECYEGSSEACQYIYERCWDYEANGWVTDMWTEATYYIPASLRSITYTGSNIPDYSFMNFSQVTHVTLGKELTSIGYYAFDNCRSINYVYYAGSKKEWGQISIGNGNYYLTRANLHTVEPIAVELTILNLPTKTVYNQGDALDTTGLTLEAAMSNGEIRTVTEGYTVLGYDASAGGIQTVTVTYAGATVTFQVEVKSLFVTDISVTQLPNKTEYWVGEALDSTGLVLLSSWTDGTERSIVSGYTLSGYDPSIPGVQTVTVRYEEVSTTFTVTVKPPYVTKVEIKQLPESLECWLFAQPDTTGLVLTVTWSNGVAEDVTEGYTVSADSQLVGQQTVTITYREQTAAYTVLVKKGGSCGDALHWILDDAGVLTISGTGKMTDFANSEAVPWYQLRDEVKKVVIEKGVTSIGKYAFSYCGNLAEITIPSGVLEIGGYAFERTHSLKQVKLPAGLQTMGSYLFYRSEGLQSIVIPDSVTSLGASVFSRCINLKQATIGAGVTKLEKYTFYTCTSLTDITVPDGVTELGDQVFENCSGLASVTLSRHLTAIGQKSFSGCTALQNVYYRNTAAKWAEITVGGTNEPLFAATLHTREETVAAAIVGQPKDILVQVGDTANFTVIAEGDGLTYKWQYKNAGATAWNNTSLTGYNTNTLTIYNVQGAGYHGRQFRCIVTDANGNTVTSEPATLNVPYIVKQPATAFGAAVNSNHQFTVAYSISEGVTYQWQYKGNTASSEWANTSMSGAKTNTLTVPAIATRNGYKYRCIINDNGTQIITKEVTLYVQAAAATITKQPVAATAVCGDYATFTVEATGDGLSYQWQWSDDGESWSDTRGTGYATSTLTVKTNNFNGGRLYRCVVKTVNGSAYNKVYSEPALMTVLPAAEITQQPQSVTVWAGETALFHVEAEGEDLSYQWQWAKYLGNWMNTTAAGNTTDTLTISGARKDMNGRYYRVIITNQYTGTVTTQYCQLFVE